MAEDGKPLKGVILCGTSLSQHVRSGVERTATQMGAEYRLHLDSRVTHLLVGSVNSEKYQHVARSRPDIIALRPEWLSAVRAAWMEGGEVDVDQLCAEYRLGAFFSLRICITGFNDLHQRHHLEETTNSNGGTYHPDLTKEVTHLVAAKPEGAKYERAKVWGTKVVSLKWFEDSLKRGMILQESLYDPLIPEEQQGRGAVDPQVGKATRRTREEDPTANASASKRRIRRTASTRLGNDSQTLLQDLSFNGDVDLPPTDDPHRGDGKSVEPQPEPTVQTQPADGLLHSISAEVPPKPLFHGWKCYLYGHDDAVLAKLREHLAANGAELVDEQSELSHSGPRSAAILPSKRIGESDASIEALPDHVKLVTEWWVERCIIYKRVLDPEQDLLSQSHIHLPKDSFRGYVISTSGFAQDVRYISRIVQGAGGTYQEDVSRSINLLIFDHSKTDVLEKPAYCAERDVDVVTPQWFFDSMKQRHPQPCTRYFLPEHLCAAVRQIVDKRRKASESRPNGQRATVQTK